MMVNTKELKKGDPVHYVPEHYKKTGNFENGIVKGFAENGGVFVVYNCNGDWDNYENYTAANTRPEDLFLGWAMTTQEKNEMIARFCGFQETALGWYDDTGILPEYVFINEGGNTFESRDLNFDDSWDWLIPVVEKIQSIEVSPAPNYKCYRIEIVIQGYVKITGFPMPSIFRNVSVEGSVIRAIYEAVVDFIKWYNKSNEN